MYAPPWSTATTIIRPNYLYSMKKKRKKLQKAATVCFVLLWVSFKYRSGVTGQERPSPANSNYFHVTSLLNQRGFVWLGCNQIRQLLFCCRKTSCSKGKKVCSRNKSPSPPPSVTAVAVGVNLEAFFYDFQSVLQITF